MFRKIEGNSPQKWAKRVAKITLKFSDICDDLLAPGNIFWRQKSGAEILISAKADFLNFELLKKLATSEKVLLIEDSIEYNTHKLLTTTYKDYEYETRFKEKLKLRTEFNALLMKHYYNSDKSQFELDQLCWKLFSEISRDDAKMYMDRDCDYFKRAMSISSSYVLSAFLIGYYDGAFLRKIYNAAILSLVNVGKEEFIVTLKADLEKLRKKSSVTEEDKIFIEKIIDTKNFNQSFLFEKFDGSGIMTINVHEMSDLELILSSLNYYYHFDEYVEHKNILAEIREGRFNITKEILNLIKRNFYLVERSIQTA